MRFCEIQGCPRPVFGTDKKTRTGYCKNHQHLRTDIDKDGILQRAIKKQRQNAVPKIQSKLRNLLKTDDEVREGSKKVERKSDLLKEADRLFADYIKARDTDKNGKVFCPCCNQTFNATDVKFGLPVINCMHFMDRDIYLLRFDEDAAHAGHAWCNKNQHYEPSGKEYQNFKKYLIGKFGESAVAEMELAKRKINKITTEQLKNIIEHYSINQLK